MISVGIYCSDERDYELAESRITAIAHKVNPAATAFFAVLLGCCVFVFRGSVKWMTLVRAANTLNFCPSLPNSLAIFFTA